MQIAQLQTSLPPLHSPGDWVRIFAYRLALRRPRLSPAAAINVAIEAFDANPALAPEQAVELYPDASD